MLLGVWGGKKLSMTEEEAVLSADDIKDFVHEKLDGYKNLSIIEQYAMFMAKAQILEFGLKSTILGNCKPNTWFKITSDLCPIAKR